MVFDGLAKELEKVTSGKILLAEPLSKHTSFKIGGPAEILVVPRKVEEIPSLVEFAKQKGLLFTLLGNGSNLLVKDGGISGLVVKLGGGPTKINIDGENLIAEAGALMPRVAFKACEQNLAGLEFMAGIPGSVGGGVVMNAGAHGQNMSQVVTQVEIINQDGDFKIVSLENLKLGYRNSSLKDGLSFVTRVYFKLRGGDGEEIRQKRERNLAVRRVKQPLSWPSAGSIFINPKEQAAGYLLEQAGIKGWVRGGAEVSEKHANFIINKGGATARDVLQLIEEARELVLKKYGVELQLEIQVLGDDLQ